MINVLSFDNNRIVLLKGSAGGRKIRLRGCDQEAVEGMQALNQSARMEQYRPALKVLSERNRLSGKEVTIVLSGRESLFREITIPYVSSAKQERAILLNELLMQLPNIGEYAIDYAVLEKDEKQKTIRCIPNVIQKKTIEEYLGLLKECGIRCGGIVTRPNCKAKLVKLSYPDDKLSVLLDVFGTHLNLSLIEHGRCIISRSVSIAYANFQDNKDVFISEAADQINKIIQFNAVRHIKARVERVLVSGTIHDKTEFTAHLKDVLEEMRPGEIECLEFRPEEKIKAKKGLESADYNGAAGALLKRGDDLDFLRAYNTKEKAKRTAADYLKIGYVCLLVIAALAAAGMTWKLKDDTDKLKAQTSVVRDYLDHSAEAAEYARLQKVQTEYASLKNRNDRLQNEVNAILIHPQFTQKNFRAMSEIMTEGMEIKEFRYADTGLMTVHFLTQNAGQVPDYIDKLRKTALFDSVSYTGWNSTEGYNFEANIMLKRGTRGSEAAK